jgi:enterobactin synthetase component D
MPSSGTQHNFLGPSRQVKTGLDRTVILYATYSIAHFDDTLFTANDIAFPDTLITAVDKRKSEFLAGRMLVSRAFEQLAISPQDIAIGHKRAPIWPRDMQGSITHSRGFCACILTTAQNLCVGIDIETLLSENALRSVRHIAMDEEDIMVQASQTSFSTQELATILFSAKETLYKALFPIVQSFFGFDAATLRDVPSADQVRLKLTRTLHPSLHKGQVFTLCYRKVDDKILTWLAHVNSP